MGYLSQFKNDIFISYRRVSNGGADRWVDSFCSHLQSELNDRVGDVAMWRDTAALHAGDRWRPEIADAVESTAIFLALINRTYFDGDECRKEMDRFLGQLKADGTGGRKLLPIFKHPVRDPAELPSEVNELGRHEFFVWEDRAFRELDARRDADIYWERMVRMATDITVALEDLQGRQKRQARGKVFIARVGPELLAERERLRGALRQRGMHVVPEHEYLWNADDHRQRIVNDLSDVLLCVHLVSRAASIEPLTPARDRLQLELAHEHMQRQGRPAPLVWIQQAAVTAEPQRLLIDYIEQTLANEAAEVLQGTLQEMESLIIDLLPQPQAAAPAEPAEVAVLVEVGDAADMPALKSLLVERCGVEPRAFEFTDSAPTHAEKLAARLATGQDVLLYWSRQRSDWVEEMLDLPQLKAHAARRRICICVAGEPSEEKRLFSSRKAVVVQATVDRGEAGLRAFLAAGGGGRA
jgi:hypothetical protein